MPNTFSNRSLPHEVKIRDKMIGKGHPVYLIAEIGNNHNGEIDLAKKTVIAAAHAGADAVKFQKRDVDNVFTKELLSREQTHSRSLGKTYRDYRLKQELSEPELVQVKELAHSLDLAFFVTPFDLHSAALLARVGMDCWKIASFDVNHAPLLEFVAKQNQPIFLSTGMSTLEERDQAVEAVLKHNMQLVINQCVSIYPTPNEDLNIGAVKTLVEHYDPLPVGYSGHEFGFAPTIAAVALGACAVERHFTYDKSLPGPDHATVSLNPLEFGQMAYEIRRIEKGVADDKIYLHEHEIAHRNKHGKSVVSRVTIPQGTLIKEDMLCFKSPGYGIKPTLIHTVIGKTAKTDIPDDTVITERHLV